MAQVSLALCPNEDRLCAVTSDNQLFEVKIITQHIKDSDMKPVISLFHGPGLNAGGITGMDTCVRKPLVATCGMDRTIRVWNIVEQRLDLSKGFQEEPYSLAMHPSGLHLVVGFADKIRLMNLLMDDVRPCHEISIKQCREVKFSNGGSMFAAVNGNVVTIFDFNTYDKLADLRGHNSKVILRLPELDVIYILTGANGLTVDCVQSQTFMTSSNRIIALPVTRVSINVLFQPTDSCRFVICTGAGKIKH